MTWSASKIGTGGRARLNLDGERVLAWDGCINVRDLGGLALEDGHETSFGVVVRADSIRGLTEDGWRALADYGVERAIDLRADDEVAEDPPDAAPIPVLRVPITPWELAALKEGWPSMREGYLALVEHFGPRFAEVISTVGDADGPVVIHCQGGRDRTGLVVALILHLVGVDPELIAADHARSDANWAPKFDKWLNDAATEAERERLRRIFVPAGRTMVGVLEEVDVRYGGPRKYLLEAGASAEKIDRLVLRLRG
jgi:protein-tyrosine phosphatase